MKTLFILTLTSALMLASAELQAATIYRVDNYFSVAKHPFLEGIQNGSLYFNDFHALPTSFPNMSLPLFPRFANVSIDGDDGVVDGIANGLTMRTNSLTRESIVLNFTPDEDGHYPRYFGFAFPAEVFSNFFPPGFVPMTEAQLRNNFEVLGVKDAFGNVVLSNFVFDTATTPIIWRADDARWGTFFGIYNELGISQVTLINSRYLDHPTYGYAIPESSSAGLCVLALVCLWTRRQRAS